MASIKMNGLAFDWPNYSKGMYDKVQREAEHPRCLGFPTRNGAVTSAVPSALRDGPAHFDWLLAGATRTGTAGGEGLLRGPRL